MSFEKKKHGVGKITALAALTGLVVSAFVTPVAFAAEAKDDGPWGTYKSNDPNLISMFYDHVGRDGSVPHTENGIEGSRKWFVDTIKEKNPNAFSDMGKPSENSGSCFGPTNETEPDLYFNVMFNFPEGSEYNTLELQKEALVNAITEWEKKGYPGFYGDYSKREARDIAKYWSGYIKDKYNTNKDSDLRTSVNCYLEYKPTYALTNNTVVQPAVDSLTSGESNPLEANVNIDLDKDGKYLDQYNELLEGKLTLTYESDNKEEKPISVTKNVKFNKNDKQFRAPEYTPQDFGLKTWNPGSLKYSLNIPGQGKLRRDYKSDTPLLAIKILDDGAGNQKPITEPADTKQSDMPKPADTKQSDTPKPKPAETKQSDTPKPVDTKQSDTPKPADTKQSDTPKPADTKQSDTPKPADTKQSDTPKPADTKQSDIPKPADTKQSDEPKPKPAVVKPVERDNTQSKRHVAVTKIADKKQSVADKKQSGDAVKKKSLASTGAGVAGAATVSVVSVLVGAAGIAARKRIK